MPTAQTPDAQARRSAEEAGLALVRELAAAISKGPIELPGFPDIALRLQELLGDDSVNTDAIVRIVGAEPMLAARIINLANSAALRHAGTQVSELRTAVSRLGFDNLRAAAVSYAVSQVARVAELRAVESQLGLLWLDSVAMACTCAVIGRHTGRVSTDKALFAGLVSNVGRIYILARAAREPVLIADAGTYQSIQEEWHLRIARVLLENWKVADEVIEAVLEWPRANQSQRGHGTLADVLATAAFLNSHVSSPELIAAELPSARALERLGLHESDCIYLLQRADEEMGTLRSVLGR